jgi:uncharacterized membrane protein YecN with MAPEG domain
MSVPIVALYGGLNAIFNVFLALRVTGARRTMKKSLGLNDGEDGLLIASRAHSNNAEYVPLALVLLLIAELCGGKSTVLHAMGGSLFVGRVLHWIGLPRPAPNAPRAIGIVLTWLVMLGAAGYCIMLR